MCCSLELTLARMIYVQDAFATTGAHTGEVAASMLKDLGVKYAIIGHSERRQKGESNEVVAAKAKATLDSGLTAIACLGETLAERDAGKTTEVVTSQLAVRYIRPIVSIAPIVCTWYLGVRARTRSCVA